MNHEFMIVDDEEVMRDSISRFLEQKGHSCETAANGKEALEVIKNDCFDVVVTDYKMPVMNGFKLLKILSNEFPETKVIILSEFSDFQDVIAASQYGAYSFCSKSRDMIKFTKIIEQIERETSGGTPLN